jgi:2,3-bisphosphoglycerate-dependent phosphoglycerate mutase
MSSLVLVRHGESRWNLSNRFTGWIDVPLSKKGVNEAERVARHCIKFEYSVAFTSALERAQATLTIILSQQNRTGIFQHPKNRRYSKFVENGKNRKLDDLPVFVTEELNERYYGELQGMEKQNAERRYGKKNVVAWRRAYTARPPGGESLKEACTRVNAFLTKYILPRVRRGDTVLCVAHGNTLRAIIKHLEHISDHDISFVNLPHATALVYTFSRGHFSRTEGAYRLDRPLR